MRTYDLAMTITLATLAACGKGVQVDNTCTCGFYTSAGQMMHWQDGSSLTFQFSPDFPLELRPAVVQSADSYNELLTKVHLTLDANGSPAPMISGGDVNSVTGDGVNGVYLVADPWPWADSNPNSDAMTVVTFSSSGITEADVFFRAHSFQGDVTLPSSLSQVTTSSAIVADPGDATGIPSSPNASPVSAGTFQPFDIEDASLNYQWIYVIGVHEFGHALGRVHTTNSDSIMFPSVPLNLESNPFTNYDLGIMQSVYAIKLQPSPSPSADPTPNSTPTPTPSPTPSPSPSAGMSG